MDWQNEMEIISSCTEAKNSTEYCARIAQQVTSSIGLVNSATRWQSLPGSCPSVTG